MKNLMKMVVFGVLIVTGFIYAAGEGTSPLDFLYIGSSARAFGTAESLVAVDNDLDALVYNPASSVQTKNPEFSFSHIEWFGDFKFEHMAFVYPMMKEGNHNGTWGANLRYFHFAPFEQIDELGNVLSKKLKGGDMALSFFYNSFLLPSLSYGIGGKFISSTLYDYKKSTFGLDIGLIYALGKFGNIAVSGRNLLMSIKYSAVKEAVSPDICAGLLLNAVDTADGKFKARILGSAVYQLNDVMDVSAGLETEILNYLVLSGGYKIFADTAKISFSAGLQNLIKGMRFSYSFIPDSNINNLHVISFAAEIGGLLGYESSEETAPRAPKKKKSVEVDEESAEVSEVPMTVDGLLDSGITDFDNGNLQSAVSKWKAVLELDPENEDAAKYVSKTAKLIGQETVDGIEPFASAKKKATKPAKKKVVVEDDDDEDEEE